LLIVDIYSHQFPFDRPSR